MSQTFKVGDRVRCIRPDSFPRGLVLVYGAEYVVGGVSDIGWLRVGTDPNPASPTWVLPDRFELITDRDGGRTERKVYLTLTNITDPSERLPSVSLTVDEMRIGTVVDAIRANAAALRIDQPGEYTVLKTFSDGSGSTVKIITSPPAVSHIEISSPTANLY